MCDSDRINVIITLQGKTPFPVGVDVVRDFFKAQELKEKYESQYEENRVYVFNVPIH